MFAVRVIIHGRVQGVGYRAWTVKTAANLGLKGWVRNRRDGTVEAVFSGAPTQISAMLAACEKGPLIAKVERVERFAFDNDVPEDNFTAKPTVDA